MYLQVLMDRIEYITFNHRLQNLRAVKHLIILGDITVKSVAML